MIKHIFIIMSHNSNISLTSLVRYMFYTCFNDLYIAAYSFLATRNSILLLVQSAHWPLNFYIYSHANVSFLCRKNCKTLEGQVRSGCPIKWALRLQRFQLCILQCPGRKVRICSQSFPFLPWISVYVTCCFFCTCGDTNQSHPKGSATSLAQDR